jgi:hypothetical protein
VANARNHIKGWFHQNPNFIFPFLAFAIPLIVRAIPEILMGQYLVGFDTIAYYVPNTLGWLNNGFNFWDLMSTAPLIYILLMGATSTGASIVIFLKILPSLILGLLGLAIYYYAHKTFSWSPKKSLLVAMLSTIYFVALRISWDMLRSELSLIFLFLALIILQKSKLSLKNGVLLSALMFLIVFTHQLITVIMFAITIATILGLYYNKKIIELRKLLVCLIPAVFLFLSIIYINYFVLSIPAIGFSNYFAGGLMSLASVSYPTLVIDTLGFLAFCYLPLVPLLVFGARRFKSNIQLKTWILWSIIPLLLVVLSPTPLLIGGVLPYRWTLLLTYPLAFYAIEGLSRIKWNWYKVGVGLILAILSVGFLALPNNSALSYFGYYPSYVPKSMLQNTMQLSDCQDTVNALSWARGNMPGNGYLLVHEAFQGWAVLNLNSNRLIFYNFQNPEEFAQKQQESNPSNSLYLIWWVNGTGWYNQSTIPASFNELYHSGNIAIYKYSTTN